MALHAGNLDLLGGELCLDFTNTVEYRGSSQPHEFLRSYADLVAWSHHADILTSEEAQRLHQEAESHPTRCERTRRMNMASISLNVNGLAYTVEVRPDTPLLWVLRDTLGLTGTKYGCGVGECGACTVHLDGEAVRSCTLPVGQVEGRAITTIEGLSPNGDHPLQRAWIDEKVSQCGYCQPGQIMAAAALLAHSPNPTDADIDAALAGNLCRCGTYQRVRRAIHRAAEGGG